MKIGMGCDHNAFEMKTLLKEHLQGLGFEIVDYGCYSKDEIDYPNIAFQVSEAILNKEVDRGILCCGTGIGMAIAANKVPGIRAAQTHDIYSSERAQLSNNAQIITLGSKVIGIEVAKKIVEIYVKITFQGGDSSRKISQIKEKENFYGKAK